MTPTLPNIEIVLRRVPGVFGTRNKSKIYILSDDTTTLRARRRENERVIIESHGKVRNRGGSAFTLDRLSSWPFFVRTESVSTPHLWLQLWDEQSLASHIS